MEHFRRHNFIWRLFTPIVRLIALIKFNYHPAITPLNAPCLVVSNHCTDWDPLLLSLTIRNHAYFIASEHIFRKKITGRLLMWLQAPITRMKGTTAGDTALSAIRRLRHGRSVALFPEGNRTYNGVNAAIIESTAKLVKVSGASLATHRFRGGYLSSPRWSGASCRKGRLTGEIVNIYPPEQLKTMTPREIADIIRRDTYENAYETQRQWMIPYKGKRLAEHLERALCICPRCRELGQLESRGDVFRCSACGMEARYTEYGFLEGSDLPFDTVLDWDLWQAEELQRRTDDAGQDCILADTDICLTEILEGHREQVLGIGTLRIYRDRLEAEGMSIPLASITGMGLSGPQSIDLTAAGRHFNLSSRQIRDLRKYMTVYSAITKPENILAI